MVETDPKKIDIGGKKLLRENVKPTRRSIENEKPKLAEGRLLREDSSKPMNLEPKPMLEPLRIIRESQYPEGSSYADGTPLFIFLFSVICIIIFLIAMLICYGDFGK